MTGILQVIRQKNESTKEERFYFFVLLFFCLNIKIYAKTPPFFVSLQPIYSKHRS
ncbi:hypothetical protein BACEGG_01785 [Bacteroides eggerthii DSM 20697]|nr:hypothetical protein BACEGG_01785 [Bacteroides eggerthii DSM 20697]